MVKNRTFLHNALEVRCFFAPTGKVEKKLERWCENFVEHTYRYDAKGHLLEVLRDGELVESYRYNQAGQRVSQQRERAGLGGLATADLRYDAKGLLERAGDTAFTYDTRGALAARRDGEGVTRYFYGNDTMLDRVVLPSIGEIRYQYRGQNPVRRFKDGDLTAEYVWRDALRLSRYLDYEHRLEYSFSYDTFGRPHRVHIAPMSAARQAPKRSEVGRDWAAESANWMGSVGRDARMMRLHDLLDENGGTLDLYCGCDQVGTLRLLTDSQDRPIKEIWRDSFGLQYDDTLPDLFMPIGFAGGLHDRDTGLIRFGWRDYDPLVGRFTAPDPLGDTGGDHDFYDYCVDDPVTMNDPTGLIPLPVLGLLCFLGGKAGALGLGLGGAYLGGLIADETVEAGTGKKSTAARDAVKRVAPTVVAASAAATAKGVLPLLPGVVSAAGPYISTAAGGIAAIGQRMGAAMEAKTAMGRILNAGKAAVEFADGYIMPVSPLEATKWTMGGAAASKLAEELESLGEDLRRKRQKRGEEK